MKIKKVYFEKNELKVYIEEKNDVVDCGKLLLQKRRDQEIDITGNFVKAEGEGKNLWKTVIDLKGLSKKCYYWDIYVEKGSKRKKLTIEPDEIQAIQEKAVINKYIESEKISVRLYPDKKGELFLKRAYADAVYQSNEANTMQLQEFIESKHCSPKGMRYVEISNDNNGRVSVVFEEEPEFENAQTAIVLVSEKNKDKNMIEAHKIGNAYEADFSELSKKKWEEKDTFALYFAAVLEGRYYMFRMKERNRCVLSEKNVGMIFEEHVRYKEGFRICESQGKVWTGMLYRGTYNEQLSILVDEEEKCKNRLMPSYRVFSEKYLSTYKYRFTIVMAVYNVQNYIMEAVESVFRQDIGFKKYIQLILVDDGSTDNSGRMCDEIAARYPKNVLVIHKENGGAASARNEGKKYAEGKYVNFMDPDDKISPDVCSKVWEFFEENQDKTDVVTFPIQFFGIIESEYWQNYKFEKGSRIIDLYKEYTISDMNTAASFIKNSVVKQHEFDGRTPVGEDLKYLLYILMNKMKLGVVDDCWYYYRRREGSLIASSQKKKGYYIDYMIYLVEEIQQFCLEKYGFIPHYVQNTLMMDLQWKLMIKEIDSEILTEEELAEYKGMMVKALRNIDDEVILSQRKLFIEYIYQIFKLKYGRRPESLKVFKDVIYRYGNTVFKRESEMSTAIQFISLNQKYLTIEGYSNMLEIQEKDVVETFVSVGGILVKCEKGTQEIGKSNFIGALCHCEPFVAKIPINEEMLGKRIYLYTVVNGHAIARRNLSFFKFTPFKNSLKQQYFVNDGLVLRRDGVGFFVEWCKTNADRIELEKEFVAKLQELSNLKNEEGLPEEAAVIQRALSYRKHYFKRIFRKKKEIWLVMDRAIIAGDNGETFFEYLNQIKPKDIEFYFVISEKSPDYERMKKIGKVVSYKSEEHLCLHLQADKIISSQVDDVIFQPFDELYDYLRDLCHYKFVFLQHGITKDDVSGWLNRYRKNIAMFVTAAKTEYQSLLDGKYYYTEKEIKLTGFPRYDKLNLQPKLEKQIVFMPTWRTDLESGIDKKTGERTYRTEFKESSYYQFYQKLIQDENLLKVMREHGYSGKFFLHPANIANISDFEGNDVIQVQQDSANYQKEFQENDLMITDYSSVAFDFAYLRKPIIYTQTDREEFFEEHLYDAGYWDYKKMGFGPVCESYGETVQAIIAQIENGCKMEDKYKERIEDFYCYFDNKNCERVYEEIRQL